MTEKFVLDPLSYYNPEAFAFPAIAQSFADAGSIDPSSFYLILDWKSSRSRTRHLLRLTAISGTFNAAVANIATDLTNSESPEQRLEVLLNKWRFQLPTATAILAILYPKVFTIYDIRVCNALGDFHQLGYRKWERPTSWVEYERFVDAVRQNAPDCLSLRDCDRWLWGKDKQKTLQSELESLMVVAGNGSND